VGPREKTSQRRRRNQAFLLERLLDEAEAKGITRTLGELRDSLRWA
jgi:hypothetical protein